MPITGELKGQVDHIWDAFASGGISNPLSVIEQFTYLIYIRGLDKKQTQLESIARLTGSPLKNSLFSDIQKPLRWSSFKDQDPEQMYELFTKSQVDNMSVFEHMKTVGNDNSVLSKFMQKATFIIATPRLLDQVVQLIDKINLDDKDAKGDLNE